MSFACDPGVTTAAYVAEQMGLPDLGAEKALDKLRDTDLNTLTPIEAMNLLFELQRKARA